MALCLYCSRIWHGQVQLGVGTCRRCVVARSWNREMAVSESRDGSGAGDHDQPYLWHHPRDHGLNTWQLAKLLKMRGKVIDHQGAVVGDEAYLAVSPGGVLVPPWMRRVGDTDEWA